MIVPTDARTEIAVLGRRPDGVDVVTRVPLPGRLTTDLGVAAADGDLTLAVGTDDRVLRIWPSG